MFFHHHLHLLPACFFHNLLQFAQNPLSTFKSLNMRSPLTLLKRKREKKKEEKLFFFFKVTVIFFIFFFSFPFSFSFPSFSSFSSFLLPSFFFSLPQPPSTGPWLATFSLFPFISPPPPFLNLLQLLQFSRPFFFIFHHPPPAMNAVGVRPRSGVSKRATNIKHPSRLQMYYHCDVPELSIEDFETFALDRLQGRDPPPSSSSSSCCCCCCCCCCSLSSFFSFYCHISTLFLLPHRPIWTHLL